jgi:hypothetical protein
MRMMYINGLWYHILEIIHDTPNNTNFFVEYIILQDSKVKYLRPNHFPFEHRLVDREQLLKIIEETEQVIWHSEERKKAYLEHCRKVSQIMREHIIKEVLVDRPEYNFDIC